MFVEEIYNILTDVRMPQSFHSGAYIVKLALGRGIKVRQRALIYDKSWVNRQYLCASNDLRTWRSCLLPLLSKRSCIKVDHFKFAIDFPKPILKTLTLYTNIVNLTAWVPVSLYFLCQELEHFRLVNVVTFYILRVEIRLNTLSSD